MRSHLGSLLVLSWPQFDCRHSLSQRALPHKPPSILSAPQNCRRPLLTPRKPASRTLQTLNDFFSSDQAQKAIQSAHMNPQEVKKAVAGLNDQELAQLASRAQKAQSDFAAGSMGDHDLLLILVLIAALILIIVAVH